MARFLLAFVRGIDDELPVSQRVYKVSENCDPYDVTIPLNTILYTFISSDAKSEKELAESFVTFQLGNVLAMNSSLDMKPENNGKLYWIGRITNFEGKEYLRNETVKSMVPTSCLGENYEIIDL